MGEDVAHLIFLCFQVEQVVFLGGHFDGDAFDDFYAEAFEAVDFLGVIREEAQFPGSQVLEDLGADPVFAQVRCKAQFFVGFDCVIALLLQGIGLELVDEAYAAAFLAHVEQDAPAFVVDALHSGCQLLAAVAAARAEDVTSEAFAVNAAEEVLAVADIALDEGDVVFAGQVIRKAEYFEIAEFRRHIGFCFTDHVLVVAAAVVLQIVDGDEFHVVLFGQFPELGRTHHRAVVGHDFAAQAYLLESCQAQQVHCGFCMAIAHEDTAAAGDEREHVARTAEIVRDDVIADAHARR